MNRFICPSCLLKTKIPIKIYSSIILGNNNKGFYNEYYKSIDKKSNIFYNRLQKYLDSQLDNTINYEENSLIMDDVCNSLYNINFTKIISSCISYRSNISNWNIITYYSDIKYDFYNNYWYNIIPLTCDNIKKKYKYIFYIDNSHIGTIYEDKTLISPHCLWKLLEIENNTFHLHFVREFIRFNPCIYHIKKNI